MTLAPLDAAGRAIPHPTGVSWGRRLAWPFTRAGRLRHALLRSARAPRDPARPGALAAALQRFRRTPAAGRHEVLIADCLIFLAWSALERHLLREAQGWLDALRHLRAPRPERVGLQGRLLQALATADDLAGYAEQAEVLLNDPVLAWERHSDLVLGVLRTLYERAGPADCARLLQCADRRLREVPQLKTVGALCGIGAGLASAAAARAWAAVIEDDLLGLAFSPRMFADALIGLARSAEWQGDWEGMRACVEQARQVLPDDAPIAYWAMRARLHAVGPALELGPEEPYAPRPRLRLRLLARLGTAPESATVERLVEACAPGADAPDGPESRLIWERVRPVLTVEGALEPRDLRRAAALAAALTDRLGPCPWAEVVQAQALIRLDGRYAEALKRLTEQEVAQEPGASELAGIARVLLGEPAVPPGDPARWGAVERLEWSLHGLLTPTAPGAEPSAEVPPWSQADSLPTGFAALEEAARAVATAVTAVADGTAGARGSPVVASPAAPDWVHWLMARCAGLYPEPGQRTAAATVLERIRPGIDREPGRPVDNESLASLVSDARVGVAERGSDDVPAHLHVLRARGNRGSPARGLAPSAVAFSPHPSPLVSALCAAELALERDYAAARADLAAGRVPAAFATLERIDRAFAATSPLTQAAWRPLIRYWLGVCAARLGRAEAGTILESLVSGIKGEEARVQLALLALRAGEVQAAEGWLCGIEPRLPAAHYALAVLAERRGERGAAQRLVDSFAAAFPAAPAPYPQAMRRLGAALAERAGQTGDAEDQLERALAADPGDAIASARLCRLRLWREYQGLCQTPDGSARASQDDRARLAGAITWVGPYVRLREGLAAPVSEFDRWRQALASAPAGVHGRDRPAWRQLVVRRLLEAGRPADALAELRAVDPAGDPSWARRVRWVLESWALVVDVGQAGTVGGHMDQSVLQSHLAACDAVPPGERDESMGRWAGLLRQALRLVQAGSNTEFGTELGPWEALEPWSMARVPALWSAQPAERARAAAALAPVLATGVGWGERQRSLLRALCAWAEGRTEDYLAAFEALAGDLDSYPVPGASLWAAAASLWLAHDAYDRLLEGDLAECVADLSDPRVRLLVALAYARSAVVEARRDHRRGAERRIRQARSTLADLLEDTGEVLSGSTGLPDATLGRTDT